MGTTSKQTAGGWADALTVDRHIFKGFFYQSFQFSKQTTRQTEDGRRQGGRMCWSVVALLRSTKDMREAKWKRHREEKRGKEGKNGVLVGQCLKKNLMKGIVYFLYDNIKYNVLVYIHNKRGTYGNKSML